MLSKKEQTHLRILDSAASMIRAHGFEALSVADVMKQSGLTHGGFYAHFANRDALLAEALAHAQQQSQLVIEQKIADLVQHGVSPLAAIIQLYLSESHISAGQAGEGCALAALGSELFRLDSTGRQVAGQSIQGFARLLQRQAPTLTKAQIYTLFSSLIGTVQLVRAMTEPQQATEYLQAVKQQLLATYTE